MYKVEEECFCPEKATHSSNLMTSVCNESTQCKQRRFIYDALSLHLGEIFFNFMQIQNKNTLSIIVPLFNEEENVIPLIENIFKTIGENQNFLELVLVDDGSCDSTVEIVSQLAEKDKRIRLIRHQENKGLGGAIRTGLKSACGDFVLYTDADLPFDFTLIPNLFLLADENSIVSGYRINRGEGFRRWILTKGYNYFIKMFFGLYLNDVNFACKIFPKRFLQQAELNSEGSFIDAEMLLEGLRLGLEIKEYPMVYFPRERGLSTLSRPKVIFFILKEMFVYAKNNFSKKTSVIHPNPTLEINE